MTSIMIRSRSLMSSEATFVSNPFPSTGAGAATATPSPSKMVHWRDAGSGVLERMPVSFKTVDGGLARLASRGEIALSCYLSRTA